MQGSSTTCESKASKQGISNYHPMQASFSFHHLSQQLAYTTQTWNFKLKRVPCKLTYEMLIQMHQSSL